MAHVQGWMVLCVYPENLNTIYQLERVRDVERRDLGEKRRNRKRKGSGRGQIN